MDVTPLIPAGHQVIESYGVAGFRVSGVAYSGSILVFPAETVAWPVATVTALSDGDFAPILSHGDIEILLLGCGRSTIPLHPRLRRALRDGGIVVDAMDTGAACRTYNVLLAEERRVAAALIKLS